jgi:hypothetical protein
MAKIFDNKYKSNTTKRPGIHSKSKTSKLKTSKNYKKKYRGQGR